MRIAVISDVHGNFAALSAVLADIERRGVDATLGLGDFLSGPFDPKSVADAMIASGMPCVRGNHDRYLADGREKDWAVDTWVRGVLSMNQSDWLKTLPATRVFEGEIFMCHATPQSDEDYWMDRFTDGDEALLMTRDHIEVMSAGFDFPVLLCGHTHVPRTLRLGDGRLLLNPGSVGLPFILGSPDARYAIIEKRDGQWSSELVAIPYDKAPAVAQAEALGYPGFGVAIETGWAKLSDL